MKAAVFAADRATALRELSSLVVPASRLEKPAAPTIGWGIPALDELTGGLPRGGLTEICGPASSGRTSALLAALAESTRRGEFCALVDATDAFDPLSAEQAGIELSRLLWVRCGNSQIADAAANTRKATPPIAARRSTPGGRGGHHPREVAGSAWKQIGSRPSVVNKGVHTQTAPTVPKNFEFQISNLQTSAAPVSVTSTIEIRNSKFEIDRLEQVLKITDLLLQGGGFGLVAVDLADVTVAAARRVPLTSWFRFRRAVENTPTSLLVLEREPHARTCASLVVSLSARHRASQPDAAPTHAGILSGLHVEAEIMRTEKKASQGVRAAFDSSTAWTA